MNTREIFELLCDMMNESKLWINVSGGSYCVDDIRLEGECISFSAESEDDDLEYDQ